MFFGLFTFFNSRQALSQSHACICPISQSQHWVIKFTKISSAVKWTFSHSYLCNISMIMSIFLSCPPILKQLSTFLICGWIYSDSSPCIKCIPFLLFLYFSLQIIHIIDFYGTHHTLFLYPQMLPYLLFQIWATGRKGSEKL